MKKILKAVLAVMMLALFLPGCAGQAGVSSNTEAPSQDPGGVGESSAAEVTSSVSSEEEQNEETGLEGLQIDSLPNWTIGSGGQFWAKATNTGREDAPDGSIYIWMDEELTPLQFLSAEDYTLCSGIYGGRAVVREKETKTTKVLAADGTDVTAEYADGEQRESVIGMWEDETGLSVWTVQEVDTYDKHCTVLSAKDAEGNLKMSWDSQQYPDLQLYASALEEFRYVSGGTYCFDQSVVDVKSGNAFNYPPSGNRYVVYGADDSGNVFTFHNNGSNRSMIKYSVSGDKIWELALFGDPSYTFGPYRDGMIYASGKDTDGKVYNGFIDGDGNSVIDTELTISNNPFFIGDYALVELSNEAGVKFVTLMDTQGNMAFEPIRGEQAYFLSGSTYAEKVAALEYYLAKIDDKIVLLSPDGDQEEIPAYWNLSSTQCARANDSFLAVEDGVLNRYRYDQ
ncbi:MAG: hypothetical protein PUC59_09165 [Firmicutes bacterium]|nr:hypothetical protein [Bacillota bacterium]